jgi:hypothetical protein
MSTTNVPIAAVVHGSVSIEPAAPSSPPTAYQPSPALLKLSVAFFHANINKLWILLKSLAIALLAITFALLLMWRDHGAVDRLSRATNIHRFLMILIVGRGVPWNLFQIAYTRHLRASLLCNSRFFKIVFRITITSLVGALLMAVITMNTVPELSFMFVKKETDLLGVHNSSIASGEVSADEMVPVILFPSDKAKLLAICAVSDYVGKPYTLLFTLSIIPDTISFRKASTNVIISTFNSNLLRQCPDAYETFTASIRQANETESGSSWNTVALVQLYRGSYSHL